MMKGKDWKIRPFTIAGIVIILVILVAAMLVQTGNATPGSGVTPSPIAAGDLTEPFRVKFKEEGTGFGSGVDVAQFSVVKFTIEPGGVFGWHQHGGPVLVVVAEGTLSYYSDEPGCQAKVYEAGSALIDPGDHTHNARNEGSTDLVLYATFLLQEGAPLRIDAPDPGVCPF